MFNPFTEEIFEEDDRLLIEKAIEGSLEDLEKLILKHQSWIYNITLKMVMDHHDAEDITQEILIKVITKLSTYNHEKSSFRTWLYRVVANHVINMKSSKKEKIISSMIDIHSNDLPDLQIPDKRPDTSPEYPVLVEETKTSCLTGMLLCLGRQARLVFILHVLFNVPDAVGSRILEIENSNYRKILSRAREKIYNFLGKNCSLIDRNNLCHCALATGTLVSTGLLDRDNGIHSQKSIGKISDIVRGRTEEYESLYHKKYLTVLREQSFYETPDLIGWIKTTIQSEDFKDFFELH